MPTLPPEMIAEIADRIRDPRLRHGVDCGTYVGTFMDPVALDRTINAENPAANHAWGSVIEQMKQWGLSMPPMHVTKTAGSISASSERADQLPLAAPATDEAITAAERALGRPLPEDLRQIYEIADGGWGPGAAYTSGHGTGFYSVSAMLTTLEDLRRRGPDWTGTITWPPTYLPIADIGGTIAYDLASGAIRAFNEYFADDGMTADQAWSTSHASLAEMLDAWLSS